MHNHYGFSEYECKIINEQIKRRSEYRLEFLKKKSDPCMHSKEAGYVFDPAIQRFMAMKTLQYEYFVPSAKAKLFGVATVILPMLLYGYVVQQERCRRETFIRCGNLVYRDRLFKLI